MKRNLLIICLLMIPAILISDELPTVDEIIEKLDKSGDELKSFTVDFVQTELNEFDEEIKTIGKAYFLSPGRYLMQTFVKGKLTEEVGKNDKYAWRTRHHLETVDRFKVKESEKTSSGIDITNTSELKEKFDLEVIGVEELDSGKAYHLSGKAKEKQKIRKVEVWINVDQPSPVVKAISHQKRVVTTFVINNIKRNVDVDEDLFIYRVPKGYEEIKQ